MRVKSALWCLVLMAFVLASCSPSVRSTGPDLLTDVPLPDGFIPPLVVYGDDHYQAGANAAATVACAWINQWLQAEAEGDEESAREAIDAMATSRDWPILLAMDPEGDFPEVIWEYADAIAGDGTVMGGRELTVEESYGGAMGCRPWRFTWPPVGTR